jgi:lysophospholipase L1-like esterase
MVSCPRFNTADHPGIFAGLLMENPGSTRFLAIVLAGLLAFTAHPVPAQISQGNAENASLYWIGTWGSAPQLPTSTREAVRPKFNNQTLRQIVHVSLGGNRVRVRLSNVYGTTPLVIGEAQVALQKSGAINVSGSNRILTFNGQTRVTLDPGATVVSDPVGLRVPSLRNVAVSIYLPQPTPAATQHLKSRQTNYVSRPGNFAAVAGQPGVYSGLCSADSGPQICTSSWYYLAGVDIASSLPAASVVALGDSITNGAWSSSNENRRWTDVLARRLVANGQPVGVLNAGIGGNTLVAAGQGPTAQKRFARDVLNQPGTQFTIVMIGINDILKGVSANSLIAGYRTLISQAHAHGLKIYGATLVPFGNATDGQEARRSAVNRWIRDSGEFDAVIDFDAVLRDPDRPRRMRPIYASEDLLHPSDAGYEAMGNAVNLSLFRNFGS